MVTGAVPVLKNTHGWKTAVGPVLILSSVLAIRLILMSSARQISSMHRRRLVGTSSLLRLPVRCSHPSPAMITIPVECVFPFASVVTAWDVSRSSAGEEAFHHALPHARGASPETGTTHFRSVMDENYETPDKRCLAI